MLGPMSLQIHRASLRAFPHFSSARVHAFGLALGLSTGLDFVSSQMMAVAGQHIQGGVHADPQAYLYAVTAYAVAAVVANLAIGRIAAHIGYRMFSLVGIVLFAIVFCSGRSSLLTSSTWNRRARNAASRRAKSGTSSVRRGDETQVTHCGAGSGLHSDTSAAHA